MAENRDVTGQITAGVGEKRQTNRVIVVEGKYDKSKLTSLVDGTVFVVNGFEIYHDKKMQQLLRELARKRGLVILTDSDGAGLQIRSFLSGLVPKEQLIHVTIPDIYGKERRKTRFSKERKLGVEGMDQALLLRILSEAGVFEEESAKREAITKAQLYALGLSGRDNSSDLREKLKQKLCFPEKMSAGLLLQILNTLYTYEELCIEMEALDAQQNAKGETQTDHRA